MIGGEIAEWIDGPEIQTVEVRQYDGVRQNTWTVGEDGVTRIERTNKSGLHADIPYVRVWKGDKPAAEYCQHNIIGVYFKEEPSVAP